MFEMLGGRNNYKEVVPLLPLFIPTRSPTGLSVRPGCKHMLPLNNFPLAST